VVFRWPNRPTNISSVRDLIPVSVMEAARSRERQALVNGVCVARRLVTNDLHGITGSLAITANSDSLPAGVGSREVNSCKLSSTFGMRRTAAIRVFT
jgi:hypothetical protein